MRRNSLAIRAYGCMCIGVMSAVTFLSRTEVSSRPHSGVFNSCSFLHVSTVSTYIGTRDNRSDVINRFVAKINRMETPVRGSAHFTNLLSLVS